MTDDRPGQLYVIAAPSGAGKTSLVQALLKSESRARFSISYTTREKRDTEDDGTNYRFVDAAAFERMAETGHFLEHARVFGNFYGTARKDVEALLAQNYDVILEIDWQGARQVREVMPECHSIFVLPPSRNELEQRLRGRSTDEPEVIERRLADSVADMGHWSEFEYVIVNDDFDKALAELRAVVAGEGDASRGDRRSLKTDIERLLS